MRMGLTTGPLRYDQEIGCLSCPTLVMTHASGRRC